MPKFSLIEGVTLKDCSKILPRYRIGDNNLICALSAADYRAFFAAAVSLLKEPVFFFIEVPEGDGDEYSTYYLDNCTVPVAKAILKRYGDILFSDGIIRFGFGSHKTEDEIFMQEFQQLSIYSVNLLPYEKLMNSLGYSRNDDAPTLWDIIDEQNPGMRECVESEDEGYPEIIENLTALGLYKA